MLKYINKYRLISKGIKIQEKMKHSPITKKNSEKSGYFQQKNSLIFKTN